MYTLSNCERSADKVKELLARDKRLIDLSAHKTDCSTYAINSKICRNVPAPKMATYKDFLAFERPELAKGKVPKRKLAGILQEVSLMDVEFDSTQLGKRARSASHCGSAEIYRMKLEALKKAVKLQICPHNFTLWRFKGLQVAHKKLKMQKKQGALSPAKKRDIRHLYNKKKSEEEARKKEKEKWEEILKLKEERQFHLGRITRYFTR